MKALKLLHAADLHLDSPFDALSPEQAAERRAGQRELLFRISDAAEKHGVSAVLLSGDIFEGEAVLPETVRDFNSSLGALSCPVLIAPGNHDPYSAHSVWETMRLPENVYIFKNTAPELMRFPGVNARFWGAGFQSSFSAPLLRGFTPVEKVEGKFDVMVLHGDTGASAEDYNPISREDLVKCGMDYVALGHIHARTPLLRAGRTTYAYPGCAEGRGFDETGEKGALLVTLSDEGVAAEFIPLGGVRYEIIPVDISGKDPLEAALSASAELTENDCCRLVLTGEHAEQPDLAALRRELEGRFRELQLRDETVQARNIWEKRGQNTLSGVFTDRLYAQHEAARDDKERRVVALAARYGLSALEDGGDLL
jgi:DNA repair exonuclease SbcCD nuclease subunit